MLTEDTKTDVINRAIQIYAFLEYEIAKGHDILVREPDGETSKLVLIYPRPDGEPRPPA